MDLTWRYYGQSLPVRGILLVWVSWIAGLTNRELQFGIGIILGKIPVGSRLSKSLFRDVLETVPEHVRTCGFRIYSSNSNRTTKMSDSVRLISSDSFLVTLSSISSEIWVIYSSLITGTNVLCDWVFLTLSCDSLDTAANFRLFLSIIIISKKREVQQLWIKYYLWMNSRQDIIFLIFKREPILITVNWDIEDRRLLPRYKR